MKIHWLGHSCFKLEESTGTSIITDPYHPYVGFSMPEVSCDAVTLSHNHEDHNFIEGIKGNPVIINKQGLFEVKGVHIRSLLTDHDKEGGRLRGQNLVFQYRLDGVEVCHLGDIGEECNAMLAEALVPTNVLLIPVGGNYTINAEEAKEYVDKLMPDVVIPMHFKTEDCSLDIDGLDDFLDLFDKDEIVYLDSDTVEFDRFDFDGESTKVYVFKSQQ